jgi:hypothetical protein
MRIYGLIVASNQYLRRSDSTNPMKGGRKHCESVYFVYCIIYLKLVSIMSIYKCNITAQVITMWSGCPRACHDQPMAGIKNLLIGNSRPSGYSGMVSFSTTSQLPIDPVCLVKSNRQSWCHSFPSWGAYLSDVNAMHYWTTSTSRSGR